MVPGRTVRTQGVGVVPVAPFGSPRALFSLGPALPHPTTLLLTHRAVDSGLASAYFAFAIIFFGTFTMNFFVAMMAVKYRDGTIQFDRSAKLEAAVSS